MDEISIMMRRKSIFDCVGGLNGFQWGLGWNLLIRISRLAHTVNVINILLAAGLDKMGSHTLLHPTSLLGLLSPKPNPGW